MCVREEVCVTDGWLSLPLPCPQATKPCAAGIIEAMEHFGTMDRGFGARPEDPGQRAAGEVSEVAALLGTVLAATRKVRESERERGGGARGEWQGLGERNLCIPRGCSTWS
jgi:hypothetical protein